MNASISHRETEIALLKDPMDAKEFLRISAESTREDGNDAAFIRALSVVIDAQGGGETGVSATQKMLEELGLRLHITISEAA